MGGGGGEGGVGVVFEEVADTAINVFGGSEGRGALEKYDNVGLFFELFEGVE